MVSCRWLLCGYGDPEEYMWDQGRIFEVPLSAHHSEDAVHVGSGRMGRGDSSVVPFWLVYKYP